MSVRRTAISGAVAATLAATLVAGPPASASRQQPAMHWSASWTSAMQHCTMRSLTFRGGRSVTIPAGQVTASDATGLHVAPLESLTITLYFATPTGPSTFHEDGLTTTYQAAGDHARNTGAAAFDGPTSHSYYYLTGVDVAARGAGTVVAFGDSITNGHNSTVGGNARYTDALAERLIADHSPLSVANAGITGNLLLHQLPCFGETGITRFGRDALGQPAVRTVILMEGSNDIWDSQAAHGCGTMTTPAVTAGQIIGGFRALSGPPTPAASGSSAPPSCRSRPTSNPRPTSSAPRRSARPSTTGSSPPANTTPSPTSPPPSPTPPTRSGSTPATTQATTFTPTTPATGPSQPPLTSATCGTPAAGHLLPLVFLASGAASDQHLAAPAPAPAAGAMR